MSILRARPSWALDLVLQDLVLDDYNPQRGLHIGLSLLRDLTQWPACRFTPIIVYSRYLTTTLNLQVSALGQDHAVCVLAIDSNTSPRHVVELINQALVEAEQRAAEETHDDIATRPSGKLSSEWYE